MTISEKLKAKLKTDVLKSLGKDKKDAAYNVYFCAEDLQTDEKLTIGPKTVDLKHKTAYFFVDKAPRYNWGHPVEYLLYDLDREAQYKTLEAEFPPLDFSPKSEKYEVVHEPVKQIDTFAEKRNRMQAMPELKIATKDSAGERYAILMSGMSNNRHLNDIEFLYRTLLDLYGFDKKNIWVLNYNGKVDYSGFPHPVEKFPGDNTAYRVKLNGSGTKKDLDKAIDEVAGKLKPKDFLLIHINNHGGGPPYDKESNICCYPDYDYYYASDFGRKMKQLPKFAELMVMMEQCHSGGFLKPVIKNADAEKIHFAAACQEENSSIGGPDFDPFARDWIAGVTGKYADGSSLFQIVDTNRDNRVSASEAFVYADEVKDPYDTPLAGEKKRGNGTELFLG